jgi:hypothetical protein
LNKTIFAQNIVTGKATLFEYEGTFFNSKQVYIFNKTDQRVMQFLCFDSPIKSQTDQVGQNLDPVIQFQFQITKMLSIVSEDVAFQRYFSTYFADCPVVTRKLKQEWYSGMAITNLFLDYNAECK